MTYSIGINWEQNSSISLFKNGRLIFASSEERFSRIKNDERFPSLAFKYIIKKYNLTKSNIDYVGFVSTQWTPSYSLTRHYTNFKHEDYIKEQEKIWYPRIFQKKKISHLKIFYKKIDFKQFPGKAFWEKIIDKNFLNNIDNASNKKLIEKGKFIRRQVLKKIIEIDDEKIFFLDHSTCHHFYSTFGSKPIENELISLSLDAFGDDINYSVSIFKNTKKNVQYKNILSGNNFIIGRLYRYITLLTGLKPNEHEYKLMGLAPYCQNEYSDKLFNKFKQFQDVKNCKFINKKVPKDLFFSIHEIIKYQRFDVIASALQRYTEYLVIKWVNQIIKQYNIKNISCAGGVFMNVKMNMLISKIKNLENIYIPPSPDDTSQSIGAIFYLNYLKNQKNYNLKNAYLGFEIKKQTIPKILNRKIIEYSGNSALNKAVRLLSNGKIVAYVYGKAEFGARALGNRSILAHPYKDGVIKNINKSIKNRDFWMPFAAIVKKSHAKKYLKLNSRLDCYRYMTLCCNVTEVGRKYLKNAIHPYDETCRPQILSPADNPQLDKLLKEFGKKNGIYSLLNTSLNYHGKPLVNSFEDAIKMLLNSELDGILSNNKLFVKKI